MQLALLIIDVTTIAERIAYTERIRQRAGGSERLARCIVLVFYYKRTSAVKDADDISLEIVDVGIDRAVKPHLRRTGLRVVEEVQLVDMSNLVEVGIRHFHMGEQFTMVSVVRRLRVPAVLEYFLNTHTIVVVLERQRLSVAGHFPKLSADRLFVSPAAIVERIADCVVGDRSAIVSSQLILPIRVAVSMRNRLNRSAQRTGGIGVAYLTQNVTTAIVIVNPRRILMRIIHSDQLSQRLVGVFC